MGLFARLADEARLLREHLYDWRRYRRESFVLGARVQAHRQAMLHILAHSLEHGMALPEPRPGFGVDKAASLLRKTESWLADHGPHPSARAAFRALEAWASHHRAAGQPMPETEAALDRLDDEWGLRRGTEAGGVEMTGRAKIAAAAEGFDVASFLRARHSVRQYASEPVDMALIHSVVADAQTAPSVCNRQTCRAYAFTRRGTSPGSLRCSRAMRGFRRRSRCSS
jgi:hypothetical protein